MVGLMIALICTVWKIEKKSQLFSTVQSKLTNDVAKTTIASVQDDLELRVSGLDMNGSTHKTVPFNCGMDEEENHRNNKDDDADAGNRTLSPTIDHIESHIHTDQEVITNKTKRNTSCTD